MALCQTKLKLSEYLKYLIKKRSEKQKTKQPTKDKEYYSSSKANERYRQSLTKKKKRSFLSDVSARLEYVCVCVVGT